MIYNAVLMKKIHTKKEPKLITVRVSRTGEQYYTYDLWFNEVEYIDGTGFINVYRDKPYTNHDRDMRSFKMRRDSLEKV